MGHSEIGKRPRTREWNAVAATLSSGADAAQVAEVTLRAAEKAFAWVQENAGFRESIRLLTQLAVAARKPDPLAHLAAAGIVVPGAASMVDLVLGVSEAVDASLAQAREGSAFGDLAQRALTRAVTGYFEERMGDLFEPTRKEMSDALKELRKPATFAKVFQSFVGHVTYESLDFFLTRELATHLGHRFPTANQKALFDGQLRTHCLETARVVTTYAEEWFAKHLHEEGGDISASSALGFGWYGMQKMRAELKARTHAN